MPSPLKLASRQAVLTVSVRLVLALLILPLVGCGTGSRVVRLETGQHKPLVHTPRGGQGPVALRKGELQQAL